MNVRLKGKEKMKIHKIEILIIDFDGLGEEGIKDVIENTRYPNDCISLEVKMIKTKEIEWNDEHPLNFSNTSDEEYQRLFSV